MIKKIKQLYKRIRRSWDKYWEKWEKFEARMTPEERLNFWKGLEKDLWQ